MFERHERQGHLSLSCSLIKKMILRMTICALMDGRCKLMIGARSARNLLSFRMRFPISDCSFSSLAKRTGVRVQVPHPQSRMGMTKTSNTLNPVRGFKAPWKEPIEPRLKKARRAFEIFSSTDRQGLWSSCHHTPKHLAADCILIDGRTSNFNDVRGERAD